MFAARTRGVSVGHRGPQSRRAAHENPFTARELGLSRKGAAIRALRRLHVCIRQADVLVGVFVRAAWRLPSTGGLAPLEPVYIDLHEPDYRQT